jgi:uncharacterized protein
MNPVRLLPIFPLPTVVLFPGELLPLHIFEPRYREMVSICLAEDRHLGMALLREGWESDYGGRPPVYQIGGAGEIVEHERLPDGRYNLVLAGRFRYRLLEELSGRPFRIARVEVLPPSAPPEETRTAIAERFYQNLAKKMKLPPLPSLPLSAEHLSGELATRLRYEPAELQTLLEIDDLEERFNLMTQRMTDWQTRIDFLEPFRAPGANPQNN